MRLIETTARWVDPETGVYKGAETKRRCFTGEGAHAGRHRLVGHRKEAWNWARLRLSGTRQTDERGGEPVGSERSNE
jgi:hypothetical protein